MAFQRLFSKRFLNSFKTNVSFERAIVSKAVRSPVVPHESFNHRGVLWRFFLLRQTAYHSGPAKLPEFPTFPVGGQDLPETRIDIINNNIKKIMRAKLIEKICIDTCENSDKGAEIAKLLDDSGIVLVLENSVLLRPNQAIERLINPSIVNPIDLIELKKMKLEKMELEEMVKKKIKIDDKVKTQIRIKDYFGLGFCIVLVFGFVFNFPELIGWNVMGDILYFIIVWLFVLGFLYSSWTHR